MTITRIIGLMRGEAGALGSEPVELEQKLAANPDDIPSRLELMPYAAST